MFKPSETAPFVKKNSKVQNRRRKPTGNPTFKQNLNLRLAEETNQEPTFGLVKKHGGRLYCKLIANAGYQIRWKNEETGQSALAYGVSFFAAYLNLEKHFNEKYAA